MAADNTPASSLQSMGPVCSDCQAGGETGDFEGSQIANWEQCAPFYFTESVSLGAAAAVGFDIAAAQALLERDFSASFAWALPTGETSPDAALGTPSTGYSPLTSVTGSIRLLDAVHRYFDPDHCDATGFCTRPSGELTSIRCNSVGPLGTLEIRASIELELADGSIVVSADDARAFLPMGQGIGLPLYWSSDLSTVEGSLRLHPTAEPPYQGWLEGTLYAYPEGVRGAISPAIGGPSDQITWQYRPLLGHFPAEDECDVGSVPVDATTAAGREALSNFTDLYPALRAAANAESPLLSTWQGPPRTNGGYTSLGIELADVAHPLCAGANGAFSFETDVHLWNSDGHLDWTGPYAGSFTAAEGAYPPTLQFSTHRLLNSTDLRDAQLGDVDLLGGLAARLDIGDSYLGYPEGGVRKGGLHLSEMKGCPSELECDTKLDTRCLSSCETSFLRLLDWSSPDPQPPGR